VKEEQRKEIIQKVDPQQVGWITLSSFVQFTKQYEIPFSVEINVLEERLKAKKTMAL